MPKKVSALTMEDRSNLTNAYQVIVTNPVNYELFRVPVTQFRGAGSFVSTNDPTTTPEDPLIPEYIDGDSYYKVSSEGITLHFWDKDNSVFDSGVKLTGTRVLSAVDYPDEIGLDLRTTNFINDSNYENDYYLNKTLNLLYGGYSSTLGFKFEDLNFQGYIGLRLPTVFETPVTDVANLLDPQTAISDYDTTLDGVDDTEKLRRRRPIHGDIYHLKLTDDEGHGGYYYTFDSSITNTGSTLFENMVQMFGFTGANMSDIRTYAREAKTWNANTAPVQNDKKYRAGDNVLDVVSGTLYYNYQEGLASGTTDLGVLFEGQTTLAGSSLKTSKDGGGNWVAPTANDSEYKTGDYILTKSEGTERIHGPYTFGASSDTEAWPLYAVLRPPVEHSYTFSSTSAYLPTDYAGDYPFAGDGTMIVDGDTARIIYTAGTKEYTLLEPVTVGYGTLPADKTITWGSTRISSHGFRWSQSPSISAPSVDIDSYYDGEVVRNANGDLFEFKEDFTTPANSTFEQLEGLRASITHKIPSSTATSYPHTLPTDATGHSDWGGSTVQDGDTLEVHYSTEKVVVFTANVNEATSVVTWEDEYYKYGARTVLGTDRTEPTANNLIYRTDDLYLTSDFGLYSYDDSGSGTWTFERVDRPNETFRRDGLLNSFNPTVGFTETKPCSMFVEAADERFVKVGDIFISKLQSTVTDKEIAYVVTKADYADGAGGVQVDRFNPRSVMYHSTNAAGRPNYSDKDYSEGDFIDSSATGWRYGPYVEGQSTDLDAWPDFMQLKETTEITDTTLTTTHELKADDGLFFFEEL